MDASQIKVVSLDCAQTLVAARWVPPVFAVECAENVGCAVHRERDGLVYAGLLKARWPRFLELNLTRSMEACDQFWIDITRDWLVEIGTDAARWTDPIIAEARRRLYHSTEIFEPFDDVLPTLQGLTARGYRLAVLSNWDVSLHAVLAGFDLTKWFEVVIASLEEGVEKPHPRLFEILCERLSCSPDQVLHVGDDVGDDLQGAQNAGMHALLLDRSIAAASGTRIHLLTDLLELLP